MDIRFSERTSSEIGVDLRVVGVFQEGGAPLGAEEPDLERAIAEVVAAGDVTGKRFETLVLYPPGGAPARRVLLVGIGEEARLDAPAAREVSATALRRARELGARTVAMPVLRTGSLADSVAAQAQVEGAVTGLYRFEGYRSKTPQDRQPDPDVLLVNGAGDAAAQGVERGKIIADGVCLARDLVNEPGNMMTPTTLAERAARLAAETGLKLEVLERAQMRALGMGILLAVAEESEQPPQLIVLEHNPGGSDAPPVVLVGKGVTFDSGGISIKPAEDMWRMKDDMAGAAAVIGALGVAARLRLPARVIGIAPCAENLPGGRAQKPGDVYTGMTGKTMEVISTDAEGRMLLADALAYAERYAPAAVIDIATLTGTQQMAFGPLAAALFANEDQLASGLLEAAHHSGERLWRMPLYEEYLEAIKSQVADVKNSGGRSGGIGTSAKFLEHFTGNYPWAHIDMASMAWSEEDKPAKPKGASGYGVRLFVEFLERWSAR